MTKKAPEPDSIKPTLLNNDDLLTSIGLEHNAYHDPNDHFQKVFNLTLEAYDSTNYMKTIENSTWGIQELINKQIALLYYRAAAHAQIAKFEKGFEDAKTIIQLAPTQALGYLRVGELLSMYGNQSRAIKVYETGLAMANDHKELLEQRSEEASLQQQQYVDIIARAPFEILSSILSHFESNETFIMSTVSKTWQRRLSDIPECWSTVRMMNGLSHQLVPVQQHIVNLELSELKSNMCDKLLVQVMDGGFSKLRKLCINDCHFQDNDTLYSALYQVSGTLKELDVRVEGSHPVHYKKILSDCPGLEKFSYIHKGTISSEASFGSLKNTKSSLLTSLDLENPSFFDEADIEETLQYCPNLRVLSVTSNHRRVSDLICNHCSKLETLWFGVPRRLHTFEPILHQDKNPNGIRNLSLGLSSADSALALIDNNRDSIESMHLFLPNGFCQLNSFANIATMTHLRTLKIVRFAADTGVAVAHILRKTPLLESLTLAWCDIESASAFESMEQLDSLKQLEFIVVTQVSQDSLQTLYRFFAKSTLQTLRLQGCYFVDDDFLQFLPSIKSLQHIRIASATKVTQTGMRNFCNNMQRHISIESIALGDMTVVTDANIETLATIQSLRRLELAGLPNRSPPLQHLSNLDIVVIDQFHGPDHRLASYEPPAYYDDDESFIFDSSDESSIDD